MNERLRRKAIRAGIMCLLAVATLGYGILEKTVTVRVEGDIQPVKTFAMTVGDALERAGIPVYEHDSVEPPLDSALLEGMSIKILRAKPITIMLNGKPRQIVVTALTVEEVLREIEMRRSMNDFVGASRSARVYPGMTIEYRQAVSLSVVHDDKTKRVVTNAPTVRKMLSELGIALGSADKVRPGLDAYPANGMTVKVLRVGVREESVDKAIEPPTQTKYVKTIEYGRRKVIQEGRPGLRVYRYRSTYVDGVRVKRKLLESKLVRKPVARVIGIGAGFPGCTCNEGSQEGGASWFDAEGLTAAHRTLPKGTVVRVTNLANGKSVNVIIRDRGPYVNGRIIDLSANAFGRIARLGAGVIKVRIRW